MKPIYDWLGHSYSGYQQLGVALMLASVVAGYDLVIGIVLAIRDTWAEKKLKIKEAKSEDKISPKDVKEFHLDYWTITAIIMFYYMTIFPFVSFGVYVCFEFIITISFNRVSLTNDVFEISAKLNHLLSDLK